MKYANEQLIENLQKLSNLTGDYEIQVYGPLVRGRILIKNGRIRHAESGETNGEKALRILISSASTKHMVRELPAGNKNEIAAMDLSPAEGIIAALMCDEEKLDSVDDNEETQLIPRLEKHATNNTDLHMYEIILELNHPLGKYIQHTLDRGRNIIGRCKGCHLVVNSNLASREHALITVSSHAVTIKDFQTLNGTKLNNQPIVEAELHDGDLLEIGDVEFNVIFKLKIRNNRQHANYVDEKNMDNIYIQETRRVHFESFVQDTNRTLKMSEILNGLFSERKIKRAHIGVANQREMTT